MDGVSNSTARRLVHRSRGFDKLRLDELVKEKERKDKMAENQCTVSNVHSRITKDTYPPLYNIIVDANLSPICNL